MGNPGLWVRPPKAATTRSISEQGCFPRKDPRSQTNWVWQPQRSRTIIMIAKPLVSAIASLLLLCGCQTPQESISKFASDVRPIELQARDAMLAGRHARADQLYAKASRQLERSSSDNVYLDGLFYLDNTRIAGNRAFMALLDGQVDKARSHFSISEHYLNSGVQAHKSLLTEREGTQQGLATILGIGAMTGAVVMGIRASHKNPGQKTQIDKALSDALDFTAKTFDSISQHISELHKLDVHRDAQHVDPDVWRSAVISDHPISRAIVRISTSGGGYCTGFFIQPRVVVTAAHCINEYRKGVLSVRTSDPRDKEHFLQNASGKILKGKYVIVAPTYDWAQTCHPEDVALIITKDASKYYLPIDTNLVAQNTPAMVIGYSGDLDKGFFQRLDYGCTISPIDDGSNRIRDNCATYPGNSGGPVFSIDYNRTENPFRVAGIVSCGPNATAGERTARQGNKAAGMAALGAVYTWVLEKHPSFGDSEIFYK